MTVRAWRLPDGLSALRVRNYALYAIGQLTSQVGNWIEVTAVSWIIYEMTNSPLLLGLNALFRVLPTLLLAVYGGAIVDRLPRRALLYATEATMLVVALTMGTLAASGALQYWHLYVLNLISGAFSAFSVPARHALFGGLVPRSDLQSAVTINSITVRSGGFIGPTVAGLALAYGGYAVPFFLNAVSFCGMLAALWAMRLTDDDTSEARKKRVSEQMAEGVRFVWTHPSLRLALCFEVAAGVFGYNTTLATIIAHDVLQTGPGGMGVLLSCVGAGGLVAIALMVMVQLKDLERLMILIGAAYVAVWAGIGMSPWFVVTATLLFAIGVVDSIWGVTRNTLAQLTVPDDMRGRVMSIVMMATRGSSQLGRVQSGLLVGLLGASAAVVAGAGIIGAVVALFWLQGARQRRLKREEDEATLLPWQV